MLVQFPKARGKFNYNQMLSELTWLRVGGPAEYFFQPADLDDLMSFMSNLPDNISFFPLGVGSNLLVRDGGIKGVGLVDDSVNSSMLIGTLSQYATQHNAW